MVKLDVGCGGISHDGFLGIDIDRKANVDLLADICHLPLPDNSVDVIVTRRCIQHVPNQQLAANELWRVLQPNGTLLVTVYSRMGWLYYHLIFNILHHGRYEKCYLCTFQNMQKLFRNFHIAKIWKKKTNGRKIKDIYLLAVKPGDAS